ncbi:MAG: hypothetical protein NUV50_13765 [Rhodospirillales bacterium]|nr:hypothetical protein [Rhodospirillales bacterium]
MHPNVKTVNPTKVTPPARKGCALDLRPVAERRGAAPSNKMNEIVANHLGESLNVIRNWLHQGR